MGDVFHYVLKLRGLPYSATEQEIVNFLEIPAEHMVQVDIPNNAEGRPSGNAFVVCNDQGSAENALNKNKQCMPGSTRYIEIFKSNEGEMNAIKNRPTPGQSGNWDGVVRLRGLPFRATQQDVENFLQGLDYMPEGLYVCMKEKEQGGMECAGDAYVQFLNYQSAEGCKQRNKQEINGRYIEVFNSSNNEMRGAMIKAAAARVQQQAPVFVPPSTFGGLKMGGGMMKQNYRAGPY